MSRRFHLPPQPAERRGTPVWIPILIGIVIGLGLGLLLNMMGIMRCCSYSADQTSTGITESAAQVVPRELLSSRTAPEEFSDSPEVSETDTEAAPVESVLVHEPPEQGVVQNAATRDPSKQIRLQVLNGCGERGIARNVAPALRKLGFDVRENRNAKNFRHETSKVYDRSGDMSLAYEVANAVGIDSSLVDELIDEELVDIDVTIVIGADYRALNLGMNE
ncbi:LytR family transcriptional regulator [bacterium]|nr:MAG: LytR family transcriptional regulator [bacterium]